MRLVVDEEIPFAGEAFSHLGSVTLLPGRAMTREALRDARALIVRSVTNVDATLLAGTGVQFVGTATTGVEHVDREYLAARNIGFAAALGCNANAVAEYVLTALLVTAHAKRLALDGKTLGIIGAGRIGSLVAAKAPALGMQTLLNDPPLAQTTGDERYRPLSEVLRADFITLHVPLTYDGPDATFYLIGADELAHMTPSAILINTARGEVVDNAALLEALTKRDDSRRGHGRMGKGACHRLGSAEPRDARHPTYCRLLLGRENQGNGDAVSRLLPFLGNRAGLGASSRHSG